MKKQTQTSKTQKATTNKTNRANKTNEYMQIPQKNQKQTEKQYPKSKADGLLRSRGENRNIGSGRET